MQSFLPKLRHARLLPYWFGAALLLLPLAIWLDLMAITDQNLRKQSLAMEAVVESVRGYYTENVIARLNPDGITKTSHQYHDQSGTIPIPATLSIELGDRINEHGVALKYRFVSDYPFAGRDAVSMTDTEALALAQFRAGVKAPHQFHRSGASLFSHELTLATPVVMQETCVSCHNAHPESPKTDWKVGDVRAIQSFTFQQSLADNLMSFKNVLAYMIGAGAFGMLFSLHQLRLAGQFRLMSEELTSNNTFLAGVSMKISRYLSPQVYRQIFSGEKDVAISTERKKLTVFFSDIKDFTQTAEQLQPEELTGLLNEYFSEMSAIANQHGATIDKFIGDAIVAFFGAPDTRGTTEDARACVQMALEMQRRLAELEHEWKARGIAHPFQARIGINTGYCNVGNFGSDERMDYTIIGAEANLAARLEAVAPPGGIVMSYETYAHVRDIVTAEAMPPKRFKGIAREVVPYVIHPEAHSHPAAEHSADGRSLTVHLERLDPEIRDRLQALLRLTP